MIKEMKQNVLGPGMHMDIDAHFCAVSYLLNHFQASKINTSLSDFNFADRHR